MNKLQTNTPLDKLLNGGIDKDTITSVYGPAGSGKSNVALCALVQCPGKVLFVDTEGISFERLKQISANDQILKKINLVKVHSWKEQHKSMLKLENIIDVGRSKFGLIVVDSISALYRLELSENNYKMVNRQLATQYSILSKIARMYNIPSLLTNQVYGSVDEPEMSSRMIAKYWSKIIVELKISGYNRRMAIIRKHRSVPEGKKVDFEITQNGLRQRTSIFSR